MAEKYIDKYWQRKIPGRFGSKEKVLFLTAQGLPATFNEGVARPEQQIVTHIFDKLVDPVFEIVEKYKERAGAPTPKVILQFAIPSNVEAEKTTGREQVQQQAFSEEQPDIEYPIEEARWSLDKVILPNQTRINLEETLNLIRKHDLIYKKWGLASVLGNTSPAISINLFGPPGTGKTRCAEGIAHALGKKLLRINFAQLESKFVGQTSQNIIAVLKLKHLLN
ncbi:MAG TPA: AAA family ATPase [Leptolyngbyaceae cyanobacterium]